MLIVDAPCYLVAEIGINHNGDLDIAKHLIYTAHKAGFDCVKFQKRTIDVVYTPEELAKPREHPFGKTNGDLKRHLEFSYDEYSEIASYCAKLGIHWTASPWDEASVDFLTQFSLPYIKIASASATDKDLLTHAARTKIPLWVSTGGCDFDTIGKIVDVIHHAGGKLGMLYYCNSTYPCPVEDLNLRGINTLHHRYSYIPIGYSGHESGVYASVMAAVLGAVSIERHVTLDRTMFGSDQAASLEPKGMHEFVRNVRVWERARGEGAIFATSRELEIMKKLRRKNNL